MHHGAPPWAFTLVGRKGLPCTAVAKLDLMGISEIAERLGVTKSRADQISRERGFPEPAARLRMGIIWQTSDVERWIAKHRPQLNEHD